MKQAYIFRIYPNKKQVLLITKSIGYCYLVFNRLLSL
ncbi:helix-turn-helix domain-containing protein [Bacillus cereus]|nr:helix-turn-helix domain-containing protein [Bacillus cereus]